MPAELGAVLDAPELEVSAEEVVEQPSEVNAEPVEAVAPVEDVKGDERLISQKWRDLKATNPELFKEYKGLFFGHKTTQDKLKDFDLDGTKGWLEEHGGREAIVSSISELQGKAQELEGIATKLANGDASLVQDLMDTSPEGFAKLAPIVAEQWAQTDPEGWGQAMSGIMAATIQQNGIPMFLEKMAMYLEVGKTDQIPAMVQQLKEWAGSFNAKATAPRTTPRKPTGDERITQREQAVAQAEQATFNTRMEGAVETFRQPLISKELDSFFKRRPNDNEAKELAIGTVKNQVVARLKADAGFQKSLNALWDRKDEAGALKLIKSRETAAIQEIAPKVGRTIFGNPGGAQQVDKKPTGTPSKADVGWSFTDKPPAPHLVDKFKTSDAMIMRGKFILKDGQKLTLEA